MPLSDSDADLLAACDVETFKASGKGGQHVNTTESGVRLRHRATGLVAASQQERSQHRNKRIALDILRRKIERLNYRPPPRLPTHRTRAAKERTLRAKAATSEKKRLRSPPRHEDD